jgi:hypothetical protein
MARDPTPYVPLAFEDNLSGIAVSGRVLLQFSASPHAFVRADIVPGTTPITDGHQSCLGLTGYRYDPRKVGKMAGGSRR